MIKNPPPGEGEQWVAKWNEMTPVGRFADPKEIGDTLVLLCSDKASTFMTGHDLVIDGGMYIEIATGDGTHWLPRLHYLLIKKYLRTISDCGSFSVRTEYGGGNTNTIAPERETKKTRKRI